MDQTSNMAEGVPLENSRVKVGKTSVEWCNIIYWLSNTIFVLLSQIQLLPTPIFYQKLKLKYLQVVRCKKYFSSACAQQGMQNKLSNFAEIESKGFKGISSLIRICNLQ